MNTHMTTRYYYTDPLAAAWMTKHFGMNICPDDREIPMAKNIALSDSGLMIQVDFAAMGAPQWRKLYIHPDSLHLLEPKVEDIIIHNQTKNPHKIASVGDGLFFTDPPEFINGKLCGFHLSKHLFKPIQRNDTPFIWPLHEEININKTKE